MRIIHVPTPGDHYSPSTGSALMTIIYELNRRHVSRGEEAVVVVAPDTRHDYGVGEVSEVALGPLPNTWQKCVDAACGAVVGHRPFSARTYARLGSLDIAHAPLVIHNTAGPIRSISRRYPKARICLYANNELFRTFTRHEARATVQRCYRVICVSHFIADQLSGKLGAPPPQLEVVHNGVDIDSFRPFSRAEEAAVPIILFVGRVVREKGVHLLVRAAVEAKRQGRAFRLRIVGSSGFSSDDALSEYEKELRAAAAPLTGMVEFIPFVDRRQIIDHYAAASIFVVPSDWDDPCPLTMGEGMASGIATIAARRGGIPELGGKAVLWFDPPETDTLAAHLMDLIDQPAERLRWGRLARKQAETFSWDRQYARFRKALSADAQDERDHDTA